MKKTENNEMKLIKEEVIFDDTKREVPNPDNSPNGLSSMMLQTAFGPQFNPMFKEAIFGENSGLN